MYRGKRKILGNLAYEMENFIEGYDIFNSELLYKLKTLGVKDQYQITKFEYRIDLICEDIYGSGDLMDELLLYNQVGINELTRGTVLNYFDEFEFLELVRSINARIKT